MPWASAYFNIGRLGRPGIQPEFLPDQGGREADAGPGTHPGTELDTVQPLAVRRREEERMLPMSNVTRSIERKEARTDKRRGILGTPADSGGAGY